MTVIEIEVPRALTLANSRTSEKKGKVAHGKNGRAVDLLEKGKRKSESSEKMRESLWWYERIFYFIGRLFLK